MNNKYSLTGIIFGLILIILPLINIISANYVLAAVILLIGLLTTIINLLKKEKKVLIIIVGILLIIFGLVLFIFPNIYLEFTSMIILILAIILALFAIYSYVKTKEAIPTIISLAIAIIYAICGFFITDIALLTAIIGIGLIIAGIIKLYLNR